MSTLEACSPAPLGAHLCAKGLQVAVVSEAASTIELCLVEGNGAETRRALGRTLDVFHGLLPLAPGEGEGLVYGLRVDGGPLLLDPYAREIVPHPTLPDRYLGRVATPLPVPEARPAPPATPASETVLYEVHVRGFSQQNPAVPEALRGTFAGLAHPSSLAHFASLGVTALSLLPVHFCLSEPHLRPLGLRNYWGYSTLGYFAADPRLSATPEDPTATRAEFRAMVDALHGAGIEVILDAVYNHTAEGGEGGPSLSLRGLDEDLYYRRVPSSKGLRYVDWTGCGNTLDTSHPRVVQLVLDSMRYWVGEMGVDGFRFDLAPVLGRGPVFPGVDDADGRFDPRAALLVAMGQDPVLARAKLIAEPWDVGPGGYQVGAFPGRFLEWNDRFRDGVRRYWLTRDVDRGEFARRLAGSSDRFHHGLRSPSASVNFVTAHDGFTLADLVAHARKHNLANGEDNRDGHGHNYSINCGVEGDTDDPAILARRERLSRALLATVLVAQGTPMLLAGDELGNGQGGNNNAYCQDNPIGWLDWAQGDRHGPLIAALLRLRREHPFLGVDAWLGPLPGGGEAVPVAWRRPDGEAMTRDDWHDPDDGALIVRLGEGERALVFAFNPGPEPRTFVLPRGQWAVALNTADASFEGAAEQRPCPCPDPLPVPAESLTVATAFVPSTPESP